MMLLRKAATLAALALCLWAVSSTAAGASEVILEPAGNITRTGTIALTTPEGTISCAVTMGGTYARASSGTLTASPAPEVNPLIGRASSSVTKRCTNGEITFLNDPPKYVWARGITSERWLMFELPVEILIEQGIYRCLYRLRVDYEYNSSNGRLTLTGSTVLTRTPLFPGICPVSIRIEGILTVVAEGGRFPVVSLR
jgi:hypothetical protein